MLARAWLFVLGAAVCAAPAFAQVVPDYTSQCSSDCLKQFADQYMAALAAHDPSSLQVNPTLRVAENSHAVALGDNIWKTVVQIDPDRMYFTDPVAGQVMVVGSLQMRAQQPFIYAIRLKIENHRLSESETMVTSDRIAGQHFSPATVTRFAPSLRDDLPAGERRTRAELLADARKVWGVDEGDVAVTPGCLHFENGESPGGGAHCQVGHPRIYRAFRAPLVDVAKGVVIGYKIEDIADPEPRTPPPGRAPEKTPVFYYWPLSFYLMQIAQFEDGKYAVDGTFMNAQELYVASVFRQ